MLELLRESILAPFEILFQIFPPSVAIPLAALLAAFMIGFTVRYMQQIEADLDDPRPTAAYDPESGYRFDVDDLPDEN